MQAYNLSACLKLHKKLIKQQLWAKIETLPDIEPGQLCSN